LRTRLRKRVLSPSTMRSRGSARQGARHSCTRPTSNPATPPPRP